MYDAIVIGGGIVGASTAYHLVMGGARTLLIDRHDVGRATDAGAGIITAGTGGLGISDSWFEIALKADRYYPELVEQLKDAGDTGYSPCGLLRVAMNDQEAISLQSALDRLTERQHRWNIPQDGDLYEVSAEEACDLFPPLGKNVQRALYFKSAARVDGRQMAAALQQAAIQHGLTVRNDSVDRLVFDDQHRVTGVQIEGETLSAERVIIAGGAWSPHFGEQLGVDIPIEPLRGQIVHLGLPGVDTSAWPIVEPFHGHYLVSWPDSRVAVGATHEKVGFDPITTAGGMAEVLGEALRVAPGLATAQFREIRVGLRPATPDQLPVLGPVPGKGNVYLATGMGATGLHLGPYCGKLAADWALNTPADVNIALFSVERFKK